MHSPLPPTPRSLKADKLKDFDGLIQAKIDDPELLERDIEEDREIQERIQDLMAQLSVKISNGPCSPISPPSSSAPDLASTVRLLQLQFAPLWRAQVQQDPQNQFWHHPCPQQIRTLEQIHQNRVWQLPHPPTRLLTPSLPPTNMNPGTNSSESSLTTTLPPNTTPGLTPSYGAQFQSPTPTNTFSRLPKLNLPVFNGESLWLLCGRCAQ